jgi:hypothetical protein
MKPYLIQRCTIRNDAKLDTGFDAHFSMDYMGSAEFEFGALPNSLKQFTRNINKLQIIEVGVKNYKGQSMWAICLPEIWEEYKVYMPDLIAEKIRLKEVTRLVQETSGVDRFDKKPIKEGGYNRVSLWWDIDNHVMFAYGKDIIKLVKKSLEEVIERKKELIAKGEDVMKASQWLPTE